MVQACGTLLKAVKLKRMLSGFDLMFAREERLNKASQIFTVKFAEGSNTLADNLENECNYRITLTNKCADNAL